MTQTIRRWATPFCALLLLALMITSCGREAPVYQPGNVIVTSEPAGAAIFLDGQDLQMVTPDTLTGLEPNNYVISVQLDGYQVNPTAQTATVSPLVTTVLPVFQLSQTTLSVTSEPTGAAIYLDGEDSGEVTPATLVGLDAGTVEVSLLLDGYLVAPGTFTATVVEGEANEVPAETFTLRAQRTVLLEGFSNVSCQGCPQMAENVAELQHREGYGLDKVLYIKYSMNWPSATDPHYLHNTAENNARMNYYLNDLLSGIPVLAMDGIKVTGTSANNTPLPDEIAVLADGSLAVDPGYLIDVTADFSNSDVPVTVTLTALEDAALAGKTLFVALAQTLIEYETAPGSEGETEFHNIFRDRADSVDALVDLTAGQTQTINTTLLRGDWDLSTLFVVAFVQDDADHTISQAGSTYLTAWAEAGQFINQSRYQRTFTSGEE